MTIDHDQLFKQLLKAFFREFLELFLPAKADIIDFGRVSFLEKEYFTDVPKGRRKHLDLVAQVGLKQGGEEFILVHVELESRRTANFPLRMYEYYSQLFLRYRLPVVPIAVFADEAVWRKPVPERYELSFGDTVYVRFFYHLIKLKHYHYQDFIKSNNPLSYALMSRMGYDKKERWRLKADFLRWILGAKVDRARESILLNFVDSYMILADSEEDRFYATVAKDNTYKEVKNMITTFERRGIKKGTEKGIRRGRKEGVREAKVEDASKMLEKGLAMDLITEITGLSRRELTKLKG